VSRLAVACVAALAALLAAPAAGAEDVSRETFARLASQAPEDEAALQRLRNVDSVEGKPVDLDRAFAGADAEDLAERLRVLDETTPVGAGAGAAAAREQAGDILDERRFHRTELPRPFAGFLGWLGDRLQPLVDGARWLADRFPGGAAALWAVVGGLVAAGAAVVALGLARRRVGGPRRGGPQEHVSAAAGPGELERLADEAERRGDHEAALRLRFRAGLLRLDRLHVLPFRESLTSGEIARQLRSREFDRLSRAFDEVVYGRRPPRAEDAEQAREGWRKVLAEASAR
jgi:Domain of unknown function (DUF4129)